MVPIRLDVTDPASVAAAAAIAGDVTLLVNNAGSSTGADLLHGDIDDIRLEMETHYFGTLNVTRAFAPVLAANGRGAVLTITTTALHVGYMDTDMAAGVDAPESDPAVIAGLALDGVAARAAEVLADDLSRQVRAGLSGQLVGTP